MYNKILCKDSLVKIQGGTKSFSDNAEITFDTPFSTIPILIATWVFPNEVAVSGDLALLKPYDITTNGFKITAGGDNFGTHFSFIAFVP